MFAKREDNIAGVIDTDGLSTLEFTLIEKKALRIGQQILPNSYHYVADIGKPENAA